ncbi:PLP-dependent transferase [Rhizopus microsporus var. microsporus]|nr:PLP-dependent transferase [Rhizopus microsporus var. microsporus]
MLKVFSHLKVYHRLNTRLSSSLSALKEDIIEPSRTLTKETMNPNVRDAEYAVLGELPARAEMIEKTIQAGQNKFKFDNVVYCNIGNPHIFNQKPITFFRQVSSLCENPDLLKIENRQLVSKLYPSDAIARAEILLKNIGFLGAYSDSKGVPHIRQNIAKFIENRDGYPADPDTIFLTQGASEGIHRVLQLLHQPNHHQKTGVMIPIPQYPIYTACLQLMGAEPVPYYLNEQKNFAVDLSRLEKSLRMAREQNVNVRALAVINPGNPTGQCLPKENIREVIQFCHENGLIAMADEVYQANVFHPQDHPFHSFKKVLRSMGPKYDNQELFSFHSTSKGMVGECGRRGGYVECVNIDPAVLQELYKIFCMFSCANVQGQIMVDLMTNPPTEGDASYPQFKAEIDAIHTSYHRRAKRLTDCFNRLEGVVCEEAKGAMYLFPRITLPSKAIREAKRAGMSPDSFYAMALLEATGVCVVPGSGFGQEPGTLHIRCSFLPEESLFDTFCKNIERFHKEFMTKYKD